MDECFFSDLGQMCGEVFGEESSVAPEDLGGFEKAERERGREESEGGRGTKE